MTVIRRARKSLCERRLAKSQRELDANFERVELRAHIEGKRDRAAERCRKGITLEPIPESVRKGIIDEELYGIDCRLHREAGLPLPRRPAHLDGGDGARRGERRIGLVPFARIMAQARDMYLRSTV